MKHLKKIIPVLLIVMLLSVVLMSGGVQASDCTHEWGEWTAQDGKHSRTCTLCNSVITEDCNYYELITRPSCTENGFTQKTCEVCGDSFQTNLTEPTGHIWNDGTLTLAPTCVDPGVMTFECSYCNERRTETVDPTGKHTDVEDPEKEATCSEPGLTIGAHCGVCGVVLIEQKPVARTEHAWDMENIEKDETIPPCLPGREIATCKNCGAKGERSVPATEEHKRLTEVAKLPTCTEGGYTQHVTCSVCNTVLFPSEPIPAKGHKWDVTVHTEPTCTTDGLCDRICLNEDCGESQANVVLPATGHTYVTVPAKAATCTQDGYTAAVSCKNCEKVLVESVSTKALGHHYELTNTRIATCTSDGRKTYNCTRCTANYSETISKLGHDLYIASTTEPTCTTMGLILQKCTRCSHTLSQSSKALGHDEVYTVIPPTCTQSGHTQVTCSRCPYSGQINPIAPTGHNGKVQETVAATCTERGYDKMRCTVCNAVYEENYKDAKGHSWAPGLEVEPTCDEEGYTLISCLFCDAEKRESPVPAIGHRLNRAVSNGNATHTGDCVVCNKTVVQACAGESESCMQATACSVCDAVYRQAIGAHTFTKYTAVDDAYHRLDCANCPEQGTETEKHSFTRGEFVATASAYFYSCRVCNHHVMGRPIGDVNGDGVIGNAGDARVALRYSVGLENLTDAAVAAADVDNDGEITASDARSILRVSVGLEEKTWSVLFVDKNGNLPN